MTLCPQCGKPWSRRGTVIYRPAGRDSYCSLCNHAGHDLADRAPEAFEMLRRLIEGPDLSASVRDMLCSNCGALSVDYCECETRSAAKALLSVTPAEGGSGGPAPCLRCGQPIDFRGPALLGERGWTHNYRVRVGDHCEPSCTPEAKAPAASEAATPRDVEATEWDDRTELHIRCGRLANDLMLQGEACGDGRLLDLARGYLDLVAQKLSQPPSARSELAALAAIEGKVDVYVRPECIFRYCPHPDVCKADDRCGSPRAPIETVAHDELLAMTETELRERLGNEEFETLARRGRAVVERALADAPAAGEAELVAAVEAFVHEIATADHPASTCTMYCLICRARALLARIREGGKASTQEIDVEDDADDDGEPGFCDSCGVDVDDVFTVGDQVLCEQCAWRAKEAAAPPSDAATARLVCDTCGKPPVDPDATHRVCRSVVGVLAGRFVYCPGRIVVAAGGGAPEGRK